MTAESRTIRDYDPNDPPRYREWVRVTPLGEVDDSPRAATSREERTAGRSCQAVRRFHASKTWLAAAGLVMVGFVSGATLIRGRMGASQAHVRLQARPSRDAERAGATQPPASSKSGSIRTGLSDIGGDLAAPPTTSRSIPGFPEEKPDEPRVAARSAAKKRSGQPSRRGEPVATSANPRATMPATRGKQTGKAFNKADEPVVGSAAPGPSGPPKDEPKEPPKDQPKELPPDGGAKQDPPDDQPADSPKQEPRQDDAPADEGN